MNEIIIHEKKNTDKKPLIAGLAMLAASAFVLVTGLTDDSFLFGAIGVLGVLYFGYCVVYALAGLSRERRLLVIGTDGISDTSVSGSKVYVPYDQIESAEVFRALKEPYIGIRIKDQEAFAETLTARDKAVMKANLQINCPPVCLRVGRAKEMDIDEIAELIRGRLPAREETEAE